MTLGTTPQPADVVNELRASFPYTFPDAASRWLADVGTSAAITFPTSFAGKSAVKVVATVGPSSLGTSHSFAGVNFGAAFPGRVLVVDICAMTKQAGAVVPSTVSITNPTVGGASPANGLSGFWFAYDTDAGSTFVGENGDMFSPSGTSGTISFGTGIATRCYIVVMAVANVPAAGKDGGGAFNTAATGLSINMNVPANGVAQAVAVKNSSNTISMSGVTLQGQVEPITGYRVAWGFSNRLGAQTGRAVSFSSSGTALCAMGAGTLG